LGSPDFGLVQILGSLVGQASLKNRLANHAISSFDLFDFGCHLV